MKRKHPVYTLVAGTVNSVNSIDIYDYQIEILVQLFLVQKHLKTIILLF